MLKVESQYHNPVFRSGHIGQKQTEKLYGRTCTHTVSHFSVFRLWSLSWALKPSWVPSASLGVLRKPVTSASSSVWGYCDLTWSRAIVWLVMSDRAATCTDSARCFCLVGRRPSFFKIYLLFDESFSLRPQHKKQNKNYSLRSQWTPPRGMWNSRLRVDCSSFHLKGAEYLNPVLLTILDRVP